MARKVMIPWPGMILKKTMLLVVPLFVAGCGGSSDLIEVKGRVLMGDKPVPKGHGYVIFHPDASKGNSSLEQAQGQIDQEGNYVLVTRENRGVAPGWYKVSVTLAEVIDPANPYVTKWLIPEKYIDPATSGLEVEVVPNPTPGAYDLKLEP
jgi:hypothetical protein